MLINQRLPTGSQSHFDNVHGARCKRRGGMVEQAGMHEKETLPDTAVE